MQSIEVTGKTLEEAKQAAVAELGVANEAELDFEVLEEGNRGMFGIKPPTYRVRATLRGETNGNGNGNGNNASQNEDTPGQEQKGDLLADTGVHEEHLGQEPSEEITDKVIALIEQIMHLADFKVEVRHHGNKGRYIQLEFVGRDSLYLTNHYAELLDALQYLGNVLIGKQIDQNARVILDAQNYRRRRAESLRNLAVSLAIQVKQRREEAELDPLPAHERRIIHRALITDEGVTTYSEGEEPNRYVVISPKR